jgi:hypothetical protein
VIIVPSAVDITQMLIRQFGREPTDVIEDMNDLLEQLPDCKFKKELTEERNDYCKRTGYCRCGQELEVIDTWKESRGEMHGREVYENMYKYGCTKCGYIKE